MRFNLLKTKQKSQKQQEKSRGRSMVEMLGVLAVAGVLSIGGIQGYNYAMTKHKANLLVQEINDLHARLGMAVDPEIKSGEEIEQITDIGALLGSPYNDGKMIKNPYTFIAQGGGTDFSIGVDGVPENVCREASRMLDNGLAYKEVSLPKINGEFKTDDTLCQSGNNLLEFASTLVCEWTGWIDHGRPLPLDISGDYEPTSDACHEGYPVDIKARAHMYPNHPIEMLEQVVSVNLKDGLICKNSDQKPGGVIPFSYCLNYEIKVLCCHRATIDEFKKQED